MFFAIAHDGITYIGVESYANRTETSGYVGEITNGTVVSQPFICPADEVFQINMLTATYNRENFGSLTIRIVDLQGTALTDVTVPLSNIANDELTTFTFSHPLTGQKGKELTLEVTSDAISGTAGTVYQDVVEDGQAALSLNYSPADTQLLCGFVGRDVHWFGKYYIYIACGGLLLLSLYMLNLLYREKKNKKSVGLKVFGEFIQYKFLLTQLIQKDFKTKYKRSVLGVLWSFLNPLLTMIVQYIVFSTIFKSDIENFPVYLLSGIVLFNFFNEAVSMALNSIVGNSNLITKVYVPKYIYPVSRVLSSCINLLLALIPLIFVILFTGTRLTIMLLLMPYCLICLIIFSIGLGMLLAAVMVFFRDVQFLWTVVSMLWLYATPIFYPESIIQGNFVLLFKMNPMYHFIRFARTVILDGISPQPQAYFFCAFFALAMLVVGALVFKKTENKFALYI